MPQERRISASRDHDFEPRSAPLSPPLSPQANAITSPRGRFSPTKFFKGTPSRHEEKFKTEMCNNYVKYGSCRYAQKCQFAHGQDELRQVPRHRKYKTEMCKNFLAKGACRYGIRCRFLHDGDESGGLSPRTSVDSNGPVSPRQWQSRPRPRATATAGVASHGPGTIEWVTPLSLRVGTPTRDRAVSDKTLDHNRTLDAFSRLSVQGSATPEASRSTNHRLFRDPRLVTQAASPVRHLHMSSQLPHVHDAALSPPSTPPLELQHRYGVRTMRAVTEPNLVHKPRSKSRTEALKNYRPRSVSKQHKSSMRVTRMHSPSGPHFFAGSRPYALTRPLSVGSDNGGDTTPVSQRSGSTHSLQSTIWDRSDASLGSPEASPLLEPLRRPSDPLTLTLPLHPLHIRARQSSVGSNGNEISITSTTPRSASRSQDPAVPLSMPFYPTLDPSPRTGSVPSSEE